MIAFCCGIFVNNAGTLFLLFMTFYGYNRSGSTFKKACGISFLRSTKYSYIPFLHFFNAHRVFGRICIRTVF